MPIVYRDQDELPFNGLASRRPEPARAPEFRSGIPAERMAPQHFVSSQSEELEPEVPPTEHPSEPWHERWTQRFFAAPTPADPLKKNGRLYAVLVLFLLAFTLVGGKLFKLQILDHGAFSEEAAEQYRTEVPITAKRGLIRDRNGIILAANAFVVKFAVDPRSIQHRDKLASIFSETFGKPAKYYETLFRDSSRRYIVIEREVPLEVAARLDSVKDRGLLRQMDSRRNYAFGDCASHVVGFTSGDGRGLAGIELMYNHSLAGHDGEQVMQRDGRGALRPDVDYEKIPSLDGENVTLTIDESIQSAAEAALKAGVAKAEAEAGIAIVMRPSTGEILALANVPDFDPNDFSNATNEMLRNRAITDAYEPGSTIKVLVAAAALEDGAMKPDDKVYAENGHWNPEAGVKITDTHEYGWLTFREALEKSSNISFAKISDKLEKRRFFKYLRDFGIGNYTGIDLPGEVRGVLHTPALWGENSKRYMAFGYELTATPIQMATAYAAIANMGTLMKPYIIAKRESANGTITAEPQEIRRVVSEQTCRTLITMMQGVVDSGTGTLVRIPGVHIAGKTGTAQQLVGGHWSKEHYTSSFTGFFPAEKPQYLISVILRSPKNGYYGGVVSGPIFREIATDIMEMNGTLPPEARTVPKSALPLVTEGVVDIDGVAIPRDSGKDSRDVWDVRGLTEEQGRSLLASQGFVVRMPRETDASAIIDDVEKCGGDTVRFALAKPIAEEAMAHELNSVAPNFVGLPMARAIKLASANGFRVRADGSGPVARQFPDAGSRLSMSESTGSPTLTLFGEEQ